MTDSKIEPISDTQLEWLEESVSSWSTALTDEVFDYYTEERGLEYETVAKFRLGVVDTPPPGRDYLQGWLSIPYLGSDGAPWKVRFRRPPRSNSEAKYLDLPNWGPRMFNVRAIHEAVVGSDSISVCEGEYDAMILEQIGLHAVAIPGFKAWRPHHRRMLAGFSRVWVWADNDESGQALADTILTSMRQARQVQLACNDVTETFIQEGAECLLNALT